MDTSRSAISRRGFLLGVGSATALAMARPRPGHAMALAEPAHTINLIAGTAKAAILGPPRPHPLHLHGHAFRVLSRNGKRRPGTGNGRTRCCCLRASGSRSPSSPTTPATGCTVAFSNMPLAG